MRVGVTGFSVVVMTYGVVQIGLASLVGLDRAVEAPALPFGVALGALVVTTVGGAIFLGSRLSRSIRQATSAMRALSEGNFEGRLALAPIRELDELSASFNAMAAKLQASTERLVHQAYHDPLTGLPNRALFMSRLSAALRGASGPPGGVAVIFVDIDRFKVLNDTLGHSVGDTLLRVLSDRLLAVAGRGTVVARLGGDEFTLLVQSHSAEAHAVEIAERICQQLSRAFSIAGHELFVTASIGISVNEAGGAAITELLRRADVALYRAKSGGRARWELYHSSLDVVSVEQLDLDTALRRAVERQQLLLHYQPEVDLATGAITGTEALLRWDHPHRGILSPADFIALAEETGEIIHIGQWVLAEACRQAVSFSERAPRLPGGLVVSVNISPSEFRLPGLAGRVAGVLRDTGLPGRQLKLELTETVLMEDVPAAIETLNALRQLGVRLAIDDFGTGYSSLSYLQCFPVDTIKIDRSFVGAIGRDHRTEAIVTAIVDLGRALSMDATAEGIEHPAQLRFLRQTGCARGQGHYFAPPLAAAAFEQLLRESGARGGRLYEVA